MGDPLEHDRKEDLDIESLPFSVANETGLTGTEMEDDHEVTFSYHRFGAFGAWHRENVESVKLD